MSRWNSIYAHDWGITYDGEYLYDKAVKYKNGDESVLSNMNKDVVTRLMKMITVSDNKLDEIKSDHAAYAKLNMLANQMYMLQQQAQEVVYESQINSRLQKIPTAFTKVPGTLYYLYTQNSKDVLSMISPEEWSTYEKYHGAYLFDFDYTFKKS